MFKPMLTLLQRRSASILGVVDLEIRISPNRRGGLPTQRIPDVHRRTHQKRAPVSLAKGTRILCWFQEHSQTLFTDRAVMLKSISELEPPLQNILGLI